ncbi:MULTISPECIES: GumC family protein [unclassified Devosia]|uniref:GumC family protein n=1 Tax=unclassified Devosia TaxID=196773 RepID=UPI000AF80FE2|nr:MULTISPECIES: GumC family protein [unclassified Devosia]MBN9364319.1 GumC family protein [Devosia sp.]
MSLLTDGPHPQSATSGARAFARLGGRPANDAVAPAPQAPRPQPEPVETVTLGKIGDFLELDLGRLFVWLRKGLLASVALAGVGAVAGGAYAVLSPPKYTVATDILIDPANLQVVSDDLFQQPGQVDNAVMTAGSKLRVLTSGNVLSRVVDKLNLVADKEFYNPGTGPGLLSSLLGSSKDEKPADPRLAALAALSARVSTSADEKSFVATLRVSSETPDKSITISSAIVDAFKAELATAEADGAGRTAAALNDRLDELKSSVKQAEEKVEAYKRDKNLATSSGELVNTQTMAQLNQQVVEAQSRVITAQSSYDELVAAGRNATTADTQASGALTTLRASAGALKQQLDAQSMVYGPRHPTIVRLNTELSAVNAQLEAEIGRIVAAAKVSLDEAKTAAAALSARADELKTSVFGDNEALVTLRELERDATSKSTIYEAFLSRARQVTEREQLDTTNVRVISTAVPPAARSWPPRTMVMLGAGAVGGFVVGMLLAMLFGMIRDMRQPPRRRTASATT